MSDTTSAFEMATQLVDVVLLDWAMDTLLSAPNGADGSRSITALEAKYLILILYSVKKVKCRYDPDADTI